MPLEEVAHDIGDPGDNFIIWLVTQLQAQGIRMQNTRFAFQHLIEAPSRVILMQDWEAQIS